MAVDIQCHIFIFCDRGHVVKSLKRNIFAAGDMAVSVFFRGTDIQQDSTGRGQIFLYALIDIGLLEEIEESHRHPSLQHPKNCILGSCTYSLIDDLSVLEAAVQDIVNRTVDAFQKNDCYAAGKIEPLEQVVDGLVREVKTRHIARLQAGACTIEYGFVLDDLLTNYERIADHCSNIAVAMIEVSEDRFDTHEYLNPIKNGESPSFEKRYERYRGRYTFEPGPSGTAAAPEQKK